MGNDNKFTGRVVEVLSNLCNIEIDNYKIISAKISGILKKDTTIMVGDIVDVEFLYGTYVIKSVKKRSNFFIRPPVANIDNLIICISLNDPKPDYLLLDKQLILCQNKNIKPIICLNKIDMISDNAHLKDEINYIKKVYGTLGIDICFVSAKQNIGIDELNKKIKGKVSAFSGNSGVGKSSITSIISKNESIEIGEISKKNLKGKNTTKYIKLYDIGENTYVLDTPGFSSYELFDIGYKDLKNYYTDFLKFKCKYEDCSHVLEDECEIKKQVNLKNIDSKRYERYKYLYLELKEKDKRKYR